MKQLKIEVPEGYEIDREKSTFENIIFKKKDSLPERWEDLKSISGYYVSSHSDVSFLEEGNFKYAYDPNSYINTFVTREQAEASIAMAQLSQLMQVYNGSWEPDWRNAQETKYTICFKEELIEINKAWIFREFLSFKEEKIRDKFLENFNELILKARPLL